MPPHVTWMQLMTVNCPFPPWWWWDPEKERPLIVNVTRSVSPTPGPGYPLNQATH